MRRRSVLGALAALPLLACRNGARASGPGQLVLKHQPLGAPGAFRRLLNDFERRHPGVQVVTELIPNASDVAHQFFLTALAGGSVAFDVFVVDVIWVREFARAGWLRDLSNRFTPAELRRDFLPSVSEVAIVGDRTFAIPWYVDAGLLYRRTDLVPDPPATYAELTELAARAMRDRPGLEGYVWQGRQYEGLVCNVYEAIWGHGGDAMQGDRLLLDAAPARAALASLRSLIARGISPASVTSAAEEETRRVFQAGRAVFMRNWPYALTEAQRPDSNIRGRVAVSALPSASGEPGPGALGGYFLGVNPEVDSPKARLAEALVAFLTGHDAARDLALAHGRNPARRDVYHDPLLDRAAPQIASLLPLLERAQARPTTPYYAMLSDTLQAEFSAAIGGIRPPEVALRRAQALADHIIGATR